MKIGIDGRAAKWYRGTGIGTYTYELINFLGKNPGNFFYYVHMPSDISFPKYSNMNILKSKNYYEKNFWDEVRNPNSIDSLDISLYHVPQNGIGLPLSQKCPYIITLHDIIPCKLPKTVNPKLLNIFNRTMPTILERSNAVITVSEFSKRDIVETFNYPKNKIFVTPLASESIYKPLDKLYSKDIIKKNYGIDGPFILYVGGLGIRKNILRVIQSFELLRKGYKKNIKLVIAGTKGPLYETYKKETERLSIENEVIFPGFISMEHMPYIYNAAEIFIYPSLYEGFGLPTIEAMSCGIPVISSNITSIPEVTGDAAILINPRDTYALSNEMYNLLTNKELMIKLKNLGIKRSKQFNWKNTAYKTMESYKILCNSNK
ncbi:glycosyltransferase family 1 protein [Hathewaya histolytica]|uniref:Glycosyltransferase n=1 Tax=Hathewaya histolytica TaxID=1498 RepID=A0A4U9RQC3_HATHI|nr:glycosyltransferase family 1 protein [Hathewaya histolytica]VTQ94279.1 glycosyltransferase [Hathewaya histolytica]